MYGEGADPDAGNIRNETPLMFAAGNGHLQIVSWLVDTEGANYTAASLPGMTPVAAAAGGGHLEVVRYLAKLGAPIDASDYFGRRVINGPLLLSMSILKISSFGVSLNFNFNL